MTIVVRVCRLLRPERDNPIQHARLAICMLPTSVLPHSVNWHSAHNLSASAYTPSLRYPPPLLSLAMAAQYMNFSAIAQHGPVPPPFAMVVLPNSCSRRTWAGMALASNIHCSALEGTSPNPLPVCSQKSPHTGHPRGLLLNCPSRSCGQQVDRS